MKRKNSIISIRKSNQGLAKFEHFKDRLCRIPFTHFATVRYSCPTTSEHQLKVANGKLKERLASFFAETGLHLDFAIIACPSWDTEGGRPMYRLMILFAPSGKHNRVLCWSTIKQALTDPDVCAIRLVHSVQMYPLEQAPNTLDHCIAGFLDEPRRWPIVDIEIRKNDRTADK